MQTGELRFVPIPHGLQCCSRASYHDRIVTNNANNHSMEMNVARHVTATMEYVTMSQGIAFAILATQVPSVRRLVSRAPMALHARNVVSALAMFAVILRTESAIVPLVSMVSGVIDLVPRASMAASANWIVLARTMARVMRSMVSLVILFRECHHLLLSL